MSDYLMGIESCGWLRHIKAVVDAAIFLTKVSPYPSSTPVFFNLCYTYQWWYMSVLLVVRGILFLK